MLMSQLIARPDLCTSVELCCRMQSTRGYRKSFSSNFVGWELNMRNPQHQDWSQTHKAPGPLHKLYVSHWNTTWPNNYVNKVKAALKSLVTITSSVSTRPAGLHLLIHPQSASLCSISWRPLYNYLLCAHLWFLLLFILQSSNFTIIQRHFRNAALSER